MLSTQTLQVGPVCALGHALNVYAKKRPNPRIGKRIAHVHLIGIAGRHPCVNTHVKRDEQTSLRRSEALIIRKLLIYWLPVTEPNSMRKHRRLQQFRLSSCTIPPKVANAETARCATNLGSGPDATFGSTAIAVAKGLLRQSKRF
jgi:hypothetical protein